MRIDQNIINAVKAVGHDRLILHETGIYSCKITDDVRAGDKGTFLPNAAIVYGVKSIVMLGDLYLTAPYGSADLREKVTKEQVKEAAENG